MPAVVTAAAIAGVDKNFRALFRRGLARSANVLERAAMVIQSSNATESLAWLADLPSIKEKVDEYHRHQLQRLGYDLDNKTFGGIVDVPLEAFEDDAVGLFGPAVTGWGEKSSMLAQHQLTDLLVNGFSGALKHRDYMGSAFFADTKKRHSKDKNSFDNKGVKKLSAANYEEALANLQERTDAEGDPLNAGMKPEDLLLVVTAEDRATAQAIVGEKELAGGGTNPNFGTAQVVVLPGLKTKAQSSSVINDADALPWYLLDVSREVKPLIHQVRVPFSIQSLTSLTDQQVFDADKVSWKVRGRGAFGYGLAEFAWGSTGADAA